MQPSPKRVKVFSPSLAPSVCPMATPRTNIKDKKSIALNVTIQSSEKTLEESDLEKINKLIISTVETKSGAKIRS